MNVAIALGLSLLLVTCSELSLKITAYARQQKIPGYAIAVYQSGKLQLFVDGKCVNGSPISSSSLFRIGSVTKSLVSLMVQKIVDQGLVSWETKVSELLPNFKLQGKEENLNLHHLFSMTSGYLTDDINLVLNPEKSVEERFKELELHGPTYKPGEQYQYSNLMYMVGGYAASNFACPSNSLENSFQYCLQHYVLNPLQMTNTFCSLDVIDDLELAAPHSINEYGLPESFDVNLDNFADSVKPAGSCWSNLDDMIKYSHFELETLKSKISDISESDERDRFSKIVKVDDNLHYGYGIAVRDDPLGQFFGHCGGTFGYSSSVSIHPSRDIFILSLVSIGNATKFLKMVIDGVLNDAKANEKLHFNEISQTEPCYINVAFSPRMEYQYQNEDLGNLSFYRADAEIYVNIGFVHSRIEPMDCTEDTLIYKLVSVPYFGDDLKLVISRNSNDLIYLLAEGKTFKFHKNNGL